MKIFTKILKIFMQHMYLNKFYSISTDKSLHFTKIQKTQKIQKKIDACLVKVFRTLFTFLQHLFQVKSNQIKSKFLSYTQAYLRIKV